jgi:hypothetical protein
MNTLALQKATALQRIGAHMGLVAVFEPGEGYASTIGLLSFYVLSQRDPRQAPYTFGVLICGCLESSSLWVKDVVYRKRSHDFIFTGVALIAHGSCYPFSDVRVVVPSLTEEQRLKGERLRIARDLPPSTDLKQLCFNFVYDAERAREVALAVDCSREPEWSPYGGLIKHEGFAGFAPAPKPGS